MENYLKMRDAYQEQKLSKNQNDVADTPKPTPEPRMTRSKTKAKAKQHSIPTILKPAVESPFSNYFG